MAVAGVAQLALACLLLAPAALATTNPCAGVNTDGKLFPLGTCSASFTQCWNHQPVKPNPRCAAPLVFNPKASPPGCSYPGGLGTICNCAAYYKGDELAACNVCKAQAKEGNFAMPGNPRAFVQCTSQKAFPAYCNGSLKWCQRKQNCDTVCN